jgi:hypothetical protein
VKALGAKNVDQFPPVEIGDQRFGYYTGLSCPASHCKIKNSNAVNILDYDN